MEIMAEEKEHKNIQPSWKEVGIKDICESITDCINKTAPTVEYPTPYKMIRTNNVRNGQIDLLEVKYVTKEIFEIWTRRIIPKKGDIILTREAPLGEVGMIKTDDYIFLGQRLMQYRADPCYLDNRFLLYAFQDRTLREQIRLLGSGATVEHMKVPDAEKLILQLPPLPEQHAIATALSDVDALIASLDKLIAKKRDIKQATMQQLLTGKTRLPEFGKGTKQTYKQTEVGMMPDDWEGKKLRDVVDFLDGRRKPIKESDRAKMRGQYPYYGASGIVDYVDDFIFNEDLILLGEDGENILSRNSKLAFRVSGKIWVNNHAHVLKPKINMDINFLTEYLESLDYEQFNTGTAQPKLNKRVCLEITLFLPSLPEQTAIATALSDMDAEIVALEEKREKTRMLKQGMMQELLTGKIRLI
jgi:restriction endonuclease S subunit